MLWHYEWVSQCQIHTIHGQTATSWSNPNISLALLHWVPEWYYPHGAKPKLTSSQEGASTVLAVAGQSSSVRRVQAAVLSIRSIISTDRYRSISHIDTGACNSVGNLDSRNIQSNKAIIKMRFQVEESRRVSGIFYLQGVGSWWIESEWRLSGWWEEQSCH